MGGEASDARGQALRVGEVGQGAVAIVVEEVHGAERVAGAGNDVEQAVAVEVLNRCATGARVQIDAGESCHVRPFRHAVLRGEELLRHEEFWRNVLRIPA